MDANGKHEEGVVEFYARNTELLLWIINNLLTESQLDVIPPGHTKPLRAALPENGK